MKNSTGVSDTPVPPQSLRSDSCTRVFIMYLIFFEYMSDEYEYMNDDLDLRMTIYDLYPRLFENRNNPFENRYTQPPKMRLFAG